MRGFRYNSLHCRQSNSGCKAANAKEFFLRPAVRPPPPFPEDIERAMIASMTGFAAATREVAGGQLAVELKSVNHRYLEFQCRMAEDLRILEPVLREAVAAGLTRGKVDCRLTFTPAGAGERSLSPDGKAMAALAEASAAVAAVFPQARALSVSEVLHWPGVLANAEVAARPDPRGRREARRAGRGRAHADAPARGRQARAGASRAAGIDGRPRGAGAAADARGDEVLPREARRAPGGSGRRAFRRAHPAGGRALRGARRRGRGTRAPRRPRGGVPARARQGRGLRQAPRLPLPGAQPRGQHARLEVGVIGHVAHLGGAEGAHRADARAGPEHQSRAWPAISSSSWRPPAPARPAS